MRAILLSIPGLFLLLACTSPQERLAEIEDGMLVLLGPAGDFKIPVQDSQLYLPLPPPLEVQDEQKNQAQKLLAKVAQIDSTALNPERRDQLRQYWKILTDLSGSQSGWPLNPLDYTLSEPLRCCLAEPGGESLAVLLEKMPDYYAEVEKRWHSTNRHNQALAAQECLAMLEDLQKLEENLETYRPEVKGRLQKALPFAEMGLKNYLAQCRSLVLE